MLKASWRRTDLETPTGETVGWGTLEATEIYKEAGQGAKRMLLRGSCDHWLGWEPPRKGADRQKLSPGHPSRANTAACFPVAATGTPKGRPRPWEDEVAAGGP